MSHKKQTVQKTSTVVHVQAPQNTWKLHSYNICNCPCTAPAHDRHVHLHMQSHLHMHTTITPNTAAHADQGKRDTRRHKKNKSAQITIPGGGLPAQYTKHLHNITTSGETGTWRARELSNVHYRGSSNVGRNYVRVHVALRESSNVYSGTLVRKFVRVCGANENRRTCTVAHSRVTTHVSTWPFENHITCTVAPSRENLYVSEGQRESSNVYIGNPARIYMHVGAIKNRHTCTSGTNTRTTQ